MSAYLREMLRVGAGNAQKRCRLRRIHPSSIYACTALMKFYLAKCSFLATAELAAAAAAAAAIPQVQQEVWTPNATVVFSCRTKKKLYYPKPFSAMFTP